MIFFPKRFVTLARMNPLSRRDFLTTPAHPASTVAAAAVSLHVAAETVPDPQPTFRGRLKQSVVHWCFRPWTVEKLAIEAAELGLLSVELVAPDQWPMLKQHGLTCAIAGSHGFSTGFANPEEHEGCIATLKRSIDNASKAGVPSVITFSGFRRGLSTDQGQANMIDGLSKIVGYAEDKKVTLCLEMLNSKVDVEMKGHPDYFCDDIERSVEICRVISSERLKVLFDIYHVQIMHGDVIRRIQKHIDWIGHVHTAGVPGRGELDNTQELNYSAILKALADVGYKGYVGHEFIPTRDHKEGLAEAARLSVV
jgi:hydroxypyruvate isomerase